MNMNFFAVGIQKGKSLDGTVSWTNRVFPLTETTRVGAVNQAERIARRDKILLQHVLPVGNQSSRDNGRTLTKNMQKEKAKKR
jgi:hypothetical protein